MRQRWNWRETWLLVLLAICRAAGDANVCTLASLGLRYKDWPIDLDHSFRPEITSYKATLDFAMKSFSVNVRPDTGCQLDGVPKKPTPVQIGGYAELRLYARHPSTGVNKTYTITVYRLLGSETELQFLKVIGGSMTPVTYDPLIRHYDVQLGLDYDQIQILYRLRDNEQRLKTSAQEQYQTGSGGPVKKTTPRPHEHGRNATNSSSESASTTKKPADSERRLLAGASFLERRLLTVEGRPQNTGENQFHDDYNTFLLDIGFSRNIVLTVQCADATQASIGTYQLHISRPGCDPHRPFFDSDKKYCVNFCSSGFYRNYDTHRCSQCNTNCKVCHGLLDCHMCKPDTSDFSYVIQPDGKCREIPNHLFKKYRWWCIGLGILLAFLVLIGCAGICQFCCSPSTGDGKIAMVRTYDSDSDEAPKYVPGRRLGMY